MRVPHSPPLASWRDRDVEEFDATVRAAAARLGLQPLTVEKDYWVCNALRAIEQGFPDQIVFKGGTSLEKLRLIQRFSEDLDLLVVAEVANLNQAKRLMTRMSEAAAAATGGELVFQGSGGRLGSAHREVYLVRPMAAAASGSAGFADPDRVLLELGQIGGRVPSSRRTIESLLTRQLAGAGLDVSAWVDLAPFQTTVLHAGRTLLEKLLRVNNFAQRQSPDPHGWPRIGRQFYDIWALLGDAEVTAFLDDREQAAEVLADCLAVSAAFGRPDDDPPVGGFAACPAFSSDGPLTAQLRRAHDDAMSVFYYGDGAGPTFDEVLARVAEHVDGLRLD